MIQEQNWKVKAPEALAGVAVTTPTGFGPLRGAKPVPKPWKPLPGMPTLGPEMAGAAKPEGISGEEVVFPSFTNSEDHVGSTANTENVARTLNAVEEGAKIIHGGKVINHCILYFFMTEVV